MDTKGALKKADLFKDFNSLELIKISEITRRRFMSKGESVLAEGEDLVADASLYIIVSGLVKVTSPMGDGKELVLAILSPPEHFGEMSFVDHRARSANVVAMEDTELFVLEHDALDKLLSENKDLSVKFYRSLSRCLVQKLRKMNARVSGERGPRRAAP